jgi:hypothetical protein
MKGKNMAGKCKLRPWGVLPDGLWPLTLTAHPSFFVNSPPASFFCHLSLPAVSQPSKHIYCKTSQPRTMPGIKTKHLHLSNNYFFQSENGFVKFSPMKYLKKEFKGVRHCGNHHSC